MKLVLTAALAFSAAVFSHHVAPLAAQVVRINYTQVLVDDLLRVHPEILAASVCAAAPDATASTVIAGRREELGQPAGADDAAAIKTERPVVRTWADRGRCDVILPLYATAGETVGTLRLQFRFVAGQREAILGENAVTLRNQWQLVIPDAATLLDPYTLGSAPDDTLAKRLTMAALARHPDFNVIAMHITPPGEKTNKVVAINRPNFLGRDSDEVDTDTEKTGRIVMQVIPKTHRMEVHMPLIAVDGSIVGTICTVSLWHDETQVADFFARSLAMRDELRPDIPNYAALFKP